MSEELKEILIKLNQYRDWVDHLGINLNQNEVEKYKSDIQNRIDQLISEVANGVNTRCKPALHKHGVSASLLNQIQIQRDIYKEREAKAFDVANHREAYENSIKSSTVDQVLLIIDSYAR